MFRAQDLENSSAVQPFVSASPKSDFRVCVEQNRPDDHIIWHSRYSGLQVVPGWPDSVSTAARRLSPLQVCRVSKPWTVHAFGQLPNGAIVAVDEKRKLQRFSPDGQPLGRALGVPPWLGRPIALTVVDEDQIAVLCYRPGLSMTRLMTWQPRHHQLSSCLTLDWHPNKIVSLGENCVALAAPAGRDADRVSVVDLAKRQMVKERLRLLPYSRHPEEGPWRLSGDALSRTTLGLTSMVRSAGQLLGITNEGCLSVWDLRPPFSLRLTLASPGGHVDHHLVTLDDHTTVFSVQRREGHRLEVVDWASMKFSPLPRPSDVYHSSQIACLALLRCSAAHARDDSLRVLCDGESRPDPDADVLIELYPGKTGFQGLKLLSPCHRGYFLAGVGRVAGGGERVQAMLLVM